MEINTPPDGWTIAHGVWTFLNAIFDDASEVMERYGLHQKSLVLLALLDTADTPQGLAHLLRTPASTLSNMLRELERKELIERSLDSHDKRKFRLRRTASGQTALDEGIAEINAAIRQRMEQLALEECDVLFRALLLLPKLTGGQAAR